MATPLRRHPSPSALADGFILKTTLGALCLACLYAMPAPARPLFAPPLVSSPVATRHTLVRAVSKRDQAIALVRRAAEVFTQRRYAESAALCRRALALDAGYVRAHTWLAASLQKLGRREEARASFTRVIALAPRSSDAARARRGLRELGPAPRVGSVVPPPPARPSAVRTPAPPVSATAVRALWSVRAHATGARALAWSPDGVLLASGGADAHVRLWEAESGRALGQWQAHREEVSGLAWSPDGSSLASSSYDNTVRVVSARGSRGTASAWMGGSAVTLSGDGHDFNALAWAREGTLLAAGAGDGKVWVWNASTRRLQALGRGHTGGVTSLAWIEGAGQSTGDEVASASLDGTVRLWALPPNAGVGARSSELRQRDSFSGGLPVTLAASPSGESIAVGAGVLVQLRLARDGQIARSLPLDKASVRSLAFAPQGDLLAVGGYASSVRLWDTRTGRPGVILGGLLSEARALAWSPDGRRLAAVSTDGTLKVWSTR